MPQPLYLMLPGCHEHPLSAFRKVPVQGIREASTVSHKLPGLRFPQTDRFPFLLLWWSLGASGLSWWAFPCHKGNQCWLLENPTSLLNTKRVTCAPIPVISALVSTNSSVGLTPTKYSLSFVFWMSLIRKIIPLTNSMELFCLCGFC